MVLLNLFLGLFVLLICTFFTGFTFLKLMYPMMKGEESVSNAGVLMRFTVFGLFFLGLIFSGSTFWNGTLGLSIFTGLGTFSLLGIIAALLLATIAYALFFFAKNKQATTSIWTSFKNKVDAILSFFGNETKSRSEFDEFESRLKDISAKSTAFVDSYGKGAVNSIITLRGNLKVAEAMDLSLKSSQYVESISSSVPQMKSIVDSISLFSNPSGNSSQINTPLNAQGQPVNKAVTYDSLKAAIVGFFKGKDRKSNMFFSSRSTYIIQSSASPSVSLETILGDWADNEKNCYLNTTRLYQISGDALIYLLENTELSPLFDIHYIEKPNKAFDINGNSIDGQLINLSLITDKVNTYNYRVQLEQGQKNQPNAPLVNIQPKIN